MTALGAQIPKKVNGISIILGTGSIGDPSNYLVRFPTIESVKDYLSTFAKRGYRQLDTARNYPPGAPETCEPVLGEAMQLIPVDGDVLRGVPFIIDTKLRCNPPNAHSAEMVEKSIQGSMAALRMDKVNAEFLHGIDPTSDTQETCRAMDKAFTEGKFDLFGLSNTSVQDLEDFMAACKDQNLTIRPNILQEDYSLLSRGCEENGLLQKAREYGLSFCAFSPAGGGIFNPQAYRERGNGRFDQDTRMGKAYRGFWYADHLLRATEQIRKLSGENGLSPHALSLRWIVWHSNLSGRHGDGIVLGSSSINQLNMNLDAIESGPLPDGILKAVEEIWDKMKLEEKSLDFQRQYQF